jgi:hypothetical protein
MDYSSDVSLELVCPIDRCLNLNVKSGPQGWFITLEKNRQVIDLEAGEAIWLKDKLFETKDSFYYSRRWLKLVHIPAVQLSEGVTFDNGLGYIPEKKQLLIKKTQYESFIIDTPNSTLKTNLNAVIRLINHENAVNNT